MTDLNVKVNMVDLKRRINKNIATLRSKGFIVEEGGVNITVKDYPNFMKEWEEKSNKPLYIKKYLDEEKRQLKRELDFLRDFKACNGENMFTPEEIQSRLSNVDMDRLNKIINGNFFDSAVMSTMVCLSSTAYLASSSSLAPNERIKLWLRNLRRIGGESVSGFALMADAGYGMGDTGTAKSPFIIKSLRDLSKYNELVHEIFLAMAATNHLRKIVPNFAYVYGFFECSPPFYGPATKEDPKAKKVATFCNTFGDERDTISAVYENISPGTSFGDFTSTASPRNFMQYYTALVMALHKGYELYKFCSYDFHDQNAILRECVDTRFLEAKKSNPNVEFYVGYPIKLVDGTYKQYYVSSPGGIPTVIDYGRSYVEVEGESYGMTGSINYNPLTIFRDKSNPLHDVYKLLGFSVMEAKRSGNVALLAEIVPLFSYFVKSKNLLEDIEEIYEVSNFDLPIFTEGRDIDDYLEYVVNYSTAMGYNIVLTDLPVGALVLTPVSDRLEINVMEEIGLSKEKLPIPSPRTVLEFYDVMSKKKKEYTFYRDQEKKEGAKKNTKLKNASVLIYREIRTNFARDNLIPALDFELKRLSDVVLDFAKATKSDSEAQKMASKFRRLEDISNNITSGITMMSFPSKMGSYFDKDMLIAVKDYIAKFAFFVEMYQSLIVSVKALYYIISAYEIVKKDNPSYVELIFKVKTVYAYIYTLIDNIQPSYENYISELEIFASIFNVKMKDKSFRSLLDWDNKSNREYKWYFRVAPTLSSLDISWQNTRVELMPV